MSDRMTPDLSTLPVVRKLAEAMSREEWEMCARIKGLTKAWADVDKGGRDILVDTHAALLADVQRPASLDALARILAGVVGVRVGATAPSWRVIGGRWTLGDAGGSCVAFDDIDIALPAGPALALALVACAS